MVPVRWRVAAQTVVPVPVSTSFSWIVTDGAAPCAPFVSLSSRTVPRRSPSALSALPTRCTSSGDIAPGVSIFSSRRTRMTRPGSITSKVPAFKSSVTNSRCTFSPASRSSDMLSNGSTATLRRLERSARRFV